MTRSEMLGEALACLSLALVPAGLLLLGALLGAK